jgi:hypothetical protein
MKRVLTALNIQISVCLLVSFMLLLCGCNQSETSSDAPASSAPETVQTTQTTVTKSSVLTPQEELEKLASMPQTAQCPICGGTNMEVTLASSEVQKGSMRAQKCIHYLYGEDYISPLSLRVYDACLSCKDAENPWHGEEYDIPVGSSAVCHGYQ